MPAPDQGSSGRSSPPPGTFRLGSVAGIEITVAQSWFLIIGMIAILVAPQIQDVEPGLGGYAYGAGAAFAILLYLTVLLHEISHALAARAFEMPVTSINLHFLGGATEIEGEAATPWREFVIAVVGPLTSLAIGGVGLLALVAVPDGLLRYTIGGLAVANLVVGAFNLVPGLPLDGGRVLQAIVWRVSRRRSLGVVVAAWGGRVTALVAASYPLILLGLGDEPQIFDYLLAFLVGTFLWTGATQAMVVSKVKAKLPAIQARTLARPAIGVPADLPLSEGIRRANEANAGSLVVITSDGAPAGVVNESAVVSTPMERRPWVSCGDLARRLEPGLLLPADLAGEPLLHAMQRTPATEYVLLESSGSVYGVLVTRDVDEAFRTA